MTLLIPGKDTSLARAGHRSMCNFIAFLIVSVCSRCVSHQKHNIFKKRLDANGKVIDPAKQDAVNQPKVLKSELMIRTNSSLARLSLYR